MFQAKPWRDLSPKERAALLVLQRPDAVVYLLCISALGSLVTLVRAKPSLFRKLSFGGMLLSLAYNVYGTVKNSNESEEEFARRAFDSLLPPDGDFALYGSDDFDEDFLFGLDDEENHDPECDHFQHAN